MTFLNSEEGIRSTTWHIWIRYSNTCNRCMRHSLKDIFKCTYVHNWLCYWKWLWYFSFQPKIFSWLTTGCLYKNIVGTSSGSSPCKTCTICSQQIYRMIVLRPLLPIHSFDRSSSFPLTFRKMIKMNAF